MQIRAIKAAALRSAAMALNADYKLISMLCHVVTPKLAAAVASSANIGRKRLQLRRDVQF